MSITKYLLCALGLLILNTTTSFADADTPHEGKAISQKELKQIKMTIFPDGTGLPAGKGDAKKGALVYKSKCAACHGGNLEGGMGGMAPKLAGEPVYGADWSTGAAWPYATSIFDYVYRAMPPDNVKSLTSNELYSLTSYILFKDKIITQDEVMDQKTLPAVEMPSRKYRSSKWEKEEKANFD